MLCSRASLLKLRIRVQAHVVTGLDNPACQCTSARRRQGRRGGTKRARSAAMLTCARMNAAPSNPAATPRAPKMGISQMR